jgi:hypothetical protein
VRSADLRGSPPVEPGQRKIVGRVVVATIAAALAAMWFYAWVLAPRGDPDRLEDQAWTDRAEARCALAREVVDAMPVQASTVASRIADVDVVTDALEAMVDDLRADALSNLDDGESVEEWLGDYEVYLEDRREFTAALADDPEARFLVTAKENRQITAALDRFADVNGMQSCMTPGDIT